MVHTIVPPVRTLVNARALTLADFDDRDTDAYYVFLKRLPCVRDRTDTWSAHFAGIEAELGFRGDPADIERAMYDGSDHPAADWSDR